MATVILLAGYGVAAPFFTHQTQDAGGYSIQLAAGTQRR
jgi:hypothetical protein